MRSGPSAPPTPFTLWQPRQPREWKTAFASARPGAPTRVARNVASASRSEADSGATESFHGGPEAFALFSRCDSYQPARDRLQAGRREVRPLHAAAVRAQRSAAPVELVAGEAVLPVEGCRACAQPGGFGDSHGCMTTAAAGVGEAAREHRLRPVRDLAVRVGTVRRAALAAVADRAAHVRRLVRDARMRAEDPVAGDGLLAGRHPDVAGHAAVGRAEGRHDDLPEADLDRRAGPGRARLGAAPLAEEVLLHRRGRRGARTSARLLPEQEVLVAHGRLSAPASPRGDQ